MVSVDTASPSRYLLLWDRMGDYHRARVREVAKLAGEENVWAGDLGSSDGMYGWESGSGYGNYFRLSDKNVEKVGALEGWSAFRSLVRKERITHVCIPGYGRASYILMLVWSRLSGREVLMFAESWYPGRKFTDRLKGWLVRKFTHRLLVSGERAKEFFSQRLNYPADRIATGYSVVDNEHFASWKGDKASPPHLLCVARFSGEKRPLMLIRAFKRSKLAEKWRLIMVGGGPLKSKMAKESEGANIALVDWLSYTDLPGLYGRASCLILPSSFEPWGLVVNEGMAAGLPVILSEQVGALPDLLREGENGWVFKSGDEDDLVRVLDLLADSKQGELDEMGRNSKRLIGEYSVENWALRIFKG